jgi:hypothetical protein
VHIVLKECVEIFNFNSDKLMRDNVRYLIVKVQGVHRAMQGV